MEVVMTLSPRDYDAVLFDLDGVLTRTASVHAAAWKKLFDRFLEPRATQANEPFVPFDIATDYPRYIDGKPRYDGVVAFFASRGIALPLGTPEDGPDVPSVRALGNLKDRYFLQHLAQHGVEPYEASIALVHTLRAQEIKTAVVSSSNNCAAVLEAVGITQLDARAGRFDAVLAEHVLAWKHLWRRFDVHIRPAGPGFKLNVPMLLRLNMLHLLQAVSPNSIGLDIGMPARGWTGEAYQGHISWDELFIFPFFNISVVTSPVAIRVIRTGEERMRAKTV